MRERRSRWISKSERGAVPNVEKEKVYAPPYYSDSGSQSSYLSSYRPSVGFHTGPGGTRICSCALTYASEAVSPRSCPKRALNSEFPGLAELACDCGMYDTIERFDVSTHCSHGVFLLTDVVSIRGNKRSGGPVQRRWCISSFHTGIMLCNYNRTNENRI